MIAMIARVTAMPRNSDRIERLPNELDWVNNRPSHTVMMHLVTRRE